MSVRGTKTQLVNLTRDLMVQWEHTKEFWLDARSQEFETKYLVPLQAQVNVTENAVDKLDGILYRVRRECE
ncbi:MAG: hypothetical protein AB1705_01425 [Verrucomicrobiota bacterium]